MEATSPHDRAQTTGQPADTSAAGTGKTFIFQRLNTTAKFPYPARFYVKRGLWELTRGTLIKYSFRKAHRWRRFLFRLFGAKMHDTAMTKSSTVVRHPWLLEMGEYTILAEYVEVYNLGPLSIGDHTVVSQHISTSATGRTTTRSRTCRCCDPRPGSGTGCGSARTRLSGPGSRWGTTPSSGLGRV